MSQDYFWLNNQLHPDSPTYNIPSVFNISGPIDIPALEKSINFVIERHEALRMTFSSHGRHPEQHIAKQLILNIEQTEFSRIHDQEELKSLINKEIVRPFNLTTGPLIRVHLIHLDTERYILIITIHHIITDLRSKEILGSEISACYNSIVKNKDLPLFEEPVPYSRLSSKYKEWISTRAAENMLDFWRDELQGRAGLINLPLDHARPPVTTSNGKSHFFQLGPQQLNDLNEFCCQQSTAPFIALLTCFLVLLARYSRQKDIVIGVPLSNRRHYESKNVIGCFVNILPLAFTLWEDITLIETLHLVRGKLLQAHRRQETAFHDIVAAVKPPRDASYNPIFQVGFTHEPPMELQLSGVNVETEKWHNKGAQVDLFLNIFEISPTIQGYFEYNADLFDSGTISRFSNQYKRLVSSLHQQFQSQVERVEILSQDERTKLLVKWNDTSKNYGQAECLNRLFEKQVVRTPENIAVIFNEISLTYREFNMRANKLAHYLTELGVGPEDIVGVCMERSLEMVIAIYAICKAGGAYVPLDPEFPQQRISFIVNETKAKVILTQKHLQSRLLSFDSTVINLDSDWHLIADYPHGNLDTKTNPDNLAYVIYTSGSTGDPKGVMNEHKGIFNRLMWMQDTFKLNQDDKVLQKTPFSFDVSVWEFFWPLFTGATLVVAPPKLHKDPTNLCNFIEQQKITTIHFVPSMLRLFLDIDINAECKSLQRVFCSGEMLTWELQQTFLKRFKCELHNLYGPTEAAVDVSHWQCKQQQSFNKVPIGYPIANTQLYVLDEQLQPVPQGVIGELFIGGIQVARGYLQREKLNQKAFIEDPFTNTPNGRLYKTGDLARYLSSGALEYIGRVDFQVKLNGNRIELTEIEASLCRHKLINESVVILHEEKGEYKQLVAYILSSANSLEELNLRQHLEKILPYYMIPSQYVLLKEFPLTASGKIDRKRLPPPKDKRPAAPINVMQSDVDHIRLVSSIWKKILDMDEIDVQRNFFDNGGNSLLATELAFDLGNIFNIKIPLVKIFQYPTILSLSRYLKDECSRSWDRKSHNGQPGKKIHLDN